MSIMSEPSKANRIALGVNPAAWAAAMAFEIKVFEYFGAGMTLTSVVSEGLASAANT